MKQILLFLLISLYLFGCSTKRDKELEQLLTESNNFEKQYSNYFLIKLEKITYDDPQRNGIYLKIVTNLHKQVDSLVSDAERFYRDSSKNHNIDDLIIRYNYLLDTLKTHIPTIYFHHQDYKNPIIKKDFLLWKSTHTDKEIALAIIGNIKRNETYVDIDIYRDGPGSFCGFDVYQQEFNEIENAGKHSYTLGMQSPHIIFEGLKEIFIDTILKNGELIKTNYSTKLNNYFATINFDSLSKGTYEIKGSVERDYHDAPPGLEKRYDLFSHTFEIKK